MLIAFTAVAVGTLIFAEASAFSKKNLREILLFSSVAQSGLVVLLFLYGLTVPAVLVLLNNVVSKLVLFTVAGKMARDLGTDDVGELKGVFVHPLSLPWRRVHGVGDVADWAAIVLRLCRQDQRAGRAV